MNYLRIFVLAAVAVAVLAQDCNPDKCSCPQGSTGFCDHHGQCHCNHHNKRLGGCSSDADCDSSNCDHGEYGACVTVHGSGDGNGEKQCECKHRKRLVTADIGCCQASDCTSTTCAHTEKVICKVHADGSGQCHDNTCECAPKHR